MAYLYLFAIFCPCHIKVLFRCYLHRFTYNIEYKYVDIAKPDRNLTELGN